MKNPYVLVITGLEWLSNPGVTKLRIHNFKKYWDQFPAARIRERLAYNQDAKFFEVVFDSSTWTGRY